MIKNVGYSSQHFFILISTTLNAMKRGRVAGGTVGEGEVNGTNEADLVARLHVVREARDAVDLHLVEFD